MKFKYKALKNCPVCQGEFRCECYKQTKAYKMNNKKTKETTKELREYCNALFVLIRDFLPLCPASNKKMWENAIKLGKKLANKHRQEFLNNLAKDVSNIMMVGEYDLEYIVKFIKTWKPNEKEN